jgi:hypothetical protein
MVAELFESGPESPWSVPGRIGAAVDAVVALQSCLDLPTVAVTGEDVRAIERLARRVDAVRLAALAAVDVAGIGDGAGMSGTAAWLAKATKADGAAAAREVGLARDLDRGLGATKAALAEGELSGEHARVIAKAVRDLPKDVTAAERDQVENDLVAKAKQVDPAKLRRAARRALDALDRSTAEADAHEDRTLREEEERARAKAKFSMHDNGDGTTSGHFTIPTLAASILRKILEQMTAPRRMTPDERGGVDGAATGTDWAHAKGLAFTQLLERLPTDHLSGKVAATIVITLTWERLLAGLGAAKVDTGTDISAGEARRLACGAGIVPAVLGKGSLPLDLGRSSRLFTEAQRVALATVYDTCAAEGCDRPYAWTELHHDTPWSQGGTTNLKDGVPACQCHHLRIHDPRYEHVITTDPNGKKTITFTRRT